MFKWIQPWVLFDVRKNGFQTLTIPISAVYKIELVAPGIHKSCVSWRYPGVRIIGKFELKKGQRITVALGQQGNHNKCGSGGSFLVLETERGQKPLLIAGGAGTAFYDDQDFARGNFKQNAGGNTNVGTSGKQEFIDGDIKNVSCVGAGYDKAPQVSNLAKGCVAPKSYREGLTGGKGVSQKGNVTEHGVNMS